MLKKALAVAITGVVALATGTALADGLPQRGSIKDSAPVVVAPNWNGFYLGVGVGYGHLVAENNYSEPGFSSSWDGEGGHGGLATFVLGFDRQIRDNMVGGLFVEYDWSSIEITYDDTSNVADGSFRLKNAWSVGARLGYLMTPTSLLYVTGGYTWADGKSNGYFDIVSGLTTYPGVTKLDLNGWFIGGGMETLLGERLALRGEVRYTKFGEELVNSDAGVPFEDHFDSALLTGRLVLTYKLHREHRHVEPLK